MTSTVSIVKPWIRTNLGLLLSYLGIILSTIIFITLLVRVGLRGELHYVWANVLPITYVITWMLLVTTFVRTIGWRIVNRAFFMGVFTMMAIAYPASRFMKVPFGENVFTTAVWVPLSEETARLALLLFLWWIINRRRHRRTGVTDMVVVSAVLSLGLSFHEDMLYPRSFSSFHNPTLLGGFTEPWGAVFPTAIYVFGQFSLGHLGFGISLGAGVGMLFALTGRKRIIGVMLALTSFVYSLMLHGLWNYFDRPAWVDTIVFKPAPWIALIIIAGAIVFDIVQRKRHQPETLAPSLAWYRVAHANAENPLRWSERMMLMSRYRREWNGYAYAKAIDSTTPDARSDEELLSLFVTGTANKRIDRV